MHVPLFLKMGLMIFQMVRNSMKQLIDNIDDAELQRLRYSGVNLHQHTISTSKRHFRNC